MLEVMLEAGGCGVVPDIEASFSLATDKLACCQATEAYFSLANPDNDGDAPDNDGDDFDDGDDVAEVSWESA